MTRYARITMHAGAKIGTRFWFEITHEDARFIRGYKVNKEGDATECTTKVDKQHLIDKEAIAKIEPAKMNNKYAELEVTQ